MLTSINPLGERARKQSYRNTLSWYLVGSVIGGAGIGLFGGSIGSLLPDGDWRFIAAAALTLLGAFLDIAGIQPPSIHRQVDENWLTRYRGWVYGFGFGLQLGFGLVTIITSATVYSTIGITVLAGSLPFGVFVGGVFGLTRALAILLTANAGDPGSLRRAMRRLQGRLQIAHVGAVGAQILVAGTAIWLVV